MQAPRKPHRYRLLLLAFSGAAMAAPDTPVDIRFTPRTPEQMSAFYAARGFPQPMVELLAKQCFITVRVHNRGTDTIWLDLSRWHFSARGKEVRRYHRNHWLPLWKDMGIPLAKQSTFRWTLLPEALDYQPDEAEGGNIILPWVKGPISLSASFASGPDQRGPLIRLRYDNLHCAEDKP
ncbi:MAG TPA: hypothetical protein ENK49_13845 [Gammaproteobacteria bacterium]|nr:hypothetical protein [Gammaproteobacteria bacterium]